MFDQSSWTDNHETFVTCSPVLRRDALMVSRNTTWGGNSTRPWVLDGAVGVCRIGKGHLVKYIHILRTNIKYYSSLCRIEKGHLVKCIRILRIYINYYSSATVSLAVFLTKEYTYVKISYFTFFFYPPSCFVFGRFGFWLRLYDRL
jgi:hypothetical protein